MKNGETLLIVSFVAVCFLIAMPWTLIVKQVFPEKGNFLFWLLCAGILFLGATAVENRIVGGGLIFGTLFTMFRVNGSEDVVLFAPVCLLSFFVMPVIFTSIKTKLCLYDDD